MFSIRCRRLTLSPAMTGRLASGLCLPDFTLVDMLKMETNVPSDHYKAEELYMGHSFCRGPAPRFLNLTVRQVSPCSPHTEALAGVDIWESSDRYPRVYSDRTLIRGQSEFFARECSRNTAQRAANHLSCLRLLSPSQNSLFQGQGSLRPATRAKRRFRYTDAFPAIPT